MDEHLKSAQEKLDQLLRTSEAQRASLHQIRPKYPLIGFGRLQRERICTSVLSLRLQKFWGLGHGEHLVLISFFDSSFDDTITEPSAHRPYGRDPDAWYDVPHGNFDDLAIEGVFWAAWREFIHPRTFTYRKLLALEPRKLLLFETSPPPAPPNHPETSP